MRAARIATLIFVAASIGCDVSQARADIASEGMAACAAVSDSLDRLHCYDDLAEHLNVGASEPAENASSSSQIGSAVATDVSGLPEDLRGWQIKESKSPMDDSLSVLVGRVALEPYHNQFGSEELGFLNIRCVENTTDLMIATDAMLGMGDTVKVTLRLDERQAFDAWWLPSTSYQSAFSPKPIAMIKELLAAKKLTARLYPMSGPDITLQFDLSGLAEVIGKVQSACNWQ
jgi:type VI secretion system protein VasI